MNENAKKSKEIYTKNLIYYMELREKTPQDMQKDLGFSESKVSKWLDAKKSPNVFQSEKIAKWLDIKSINFFKDIDRSDDAVKSRAFKKAAIIFKMLDNYSPGQIEIAKNEIDSFFNYSTSYKNNNSHS